MKLYPALKVTHTNLIVFGLTTLLVSLGYSYYTFSTPISSRELSTLPTCEKDWLAKLRQLEHGQSVPPTC